MHQREHKISILDVIKKIGKWHKGAVVSDSEMAKTLTDIFDFLTPGNFKFFNRDRLNEALEWAAN